MTRNEAATTKCRCTEAACAPHNSHALVARDEAVQGAVADEARELLQAVLLRQLPYVVQADGAWGAAGV